MDIETKARTVIVSPVTIDLNIHVIRDAFSEIGEVESVHIDPDLGCAYVVYENQKDALSALQRDGARIEGHVVSICHMIKNDKEITEWNNRTQGANLQVMEYEKKAFSILSYSQYDRDKKLEELFLQFNSQQRNAFMEVYRKCQNIVTIQKQFDEAIEMADDPNYKMPSLDSSSSSSSDSRRKRSRSRHHSHHSRKRHYHHSRNHSR